MSNARQEARELALRVLREDGRRLGRNASWDKIMGALIEAGLDFGCRSRAVWCRRYLTAQKGRATKKRDLSLSAPPARRERRPRVIRNLGAPSREFATSPEFLSSWEWLTLRYYVLKKLGRRCLCCGRSPDDGIQICVDHIKPRATHPELALEESNLQILCGECNKGKGAWDTTDWRHGS